MASKGMYMKKNKNCVLLLSLSVLFLFQCNELRDEAGPEGAGESVQQAVNPSVPAPRRSWTYLFYNAADFTPGYDPSFDFSREMKESTDDIYVLMLRDVHPDNAANCNVYLKRPRNDDTAAIFRVKNGLVALQKELGEVNMGQAQTLADFITFGKTYFPADRYLLAFYDHGGGYSGSCSDQTDDDWLTMVEKRQALEQAGRVDMVLFTAPCLMASIEAMFEIKDFTDVFIGSENTSGYCYWFETMGNLRKLLEAGSAIGTLDLARDIIHSLAENGGRQCGEEQMTFSAVKSEGMEALVTLFAEICEHYEGQKDRFAEFLSAHYGEMQSYYNYNMDLHSLLSVLSEGETDAEMLGKLSRLKEMIGRAVLAEAHGAEVPDSRGIAIFCPKAGMMGHNQSQYSNTQFAQACKWGELLDHYVNGTPGARTLRTLHLQHDGRVPPSPAE